jgi:hypothetical protein
MIKEKKNVTMPNEIREKIMAYKNLFAGESGDKVLDDLEHYCMWYTPTVVKREGEQIDSKELAFLEGRRDVLKMIKIYIKQDLPVG